MPLITERIAPRNAPPGLLLSSEHELWLQWLQWVDSRVAQNPGPEEAVVLLTCYAPGFDPSEDDILQWLKSLLRRVGAALISDSRRVPSGHGLFYMKETVDFGGTWYQPTIEVTECGMWQARLIVHELGHLLLLSLVSSVAVCDGFRKKYDDHRAAEGFCEDVVHALLRDWQPEKPTPDIWPIIESRMSRRTLADVQTVKEATGVAITHLHLFALADYTRRSVRGIMPWLHQSKVLDAVRTGIAVLRLARHNAPAKARRHAGLALRVWQVAVPSWGFLPKNQRAVSAGFFTAPDAFDKGRSGKVWSVQETLEVSEDCQVLHADSAVKYRKRRMTTTCCYVPIDVKQEGRYLLAIWPWSFADQDNRKLP